MLPLLPLLLSTAAQIGAPLIKGILQKEVGGTVSDLGGTIIDAIAAKAGVEPANLPNVSPGALAAAVAATEQETPEIILAHLEQQKATNTLLLAEMAKGGESTWTWAWRPAWMWFLMVVWGFEFLITPIINAALHASIPIADTGVLTTLTIAYLGLYMGGHTAKSIFSPTK